ncbi:methyltransferase domain-containing protein [Bradyrhizobium sp. U87765 SZCCT0131]|uniref:class I SAM-dependent methyltransferase n=1 Tax=unclassified Bradyrhizobium TaxID=2631580 RepID=UPI001BA9AF37|nr:MULTISPECIES: methyltransferase domain-containing protein [unclassified Bradyrhizobium]MBR1217851.1 methyltransferase domain-containing protein [Bradyrhizobium sp. U87765 SZCCT0131]MBR1261203.1 methyltransferase domain-containing protein [Bradyrhizobium sp. U87765 SZCCT0134]MBR1303349.1 methyltransferase domain-containing protein [Bradyrhizobium sp. U87765 SZCCT0110]MBR1318955.1 methyltransferase domain-containing protein [Bradyrhizobium sp. U87765 SZCCT0109]MBR1347280.1 methyltransferase d
MDIQHAKSTPPGASKGVWEDAQAYELYIGRWGRVASREFVSWLAPPSRLKWLDVGCGTGALSEAIVDTAPESVTAVDRSDGYLALARKMIPGAGVTFLTGDAQDLQFPDTSFDATVSASMLNFLADPPRAAREMCRVTRSGGRVAAYIWDYAEGMQFLRAIWAVAFKLDPEAIKHDEGHRSSIRTIDDMANLFAACDLTQLETCKIQIPTRFANFDAYWKPFLGGQGTVSSYVCRLSSELREELKEGVRRALPTAADGSIHLTAQALAVRARRPQARLGVRPLRS